MRTDTNAGINSIILAEDDPDDQNIFQLAVQQIAPAIKLDVVPNGVALIALLKIFLPDLIFLDLEMPYKNGFESLLEIRNNPKLEHIPVIVFSSTTRPSNIQTAYEMGAHLFFVKPSVYQVFVSSINAILKLNWKNADSIKEQYCLNGRYMAFA